MKSKLLTTVLGLVFSFVSYAQYTSIPDSNFEIALAAYDDIPNDNQVPTANINLLTFLDVGGMNISDLTGVQDFVSLTTLGCYNNKLTSLNVTQNTSLTALVCFGNQLTSLDVSQNISLVEFFCQANLLTSIDVSNNLNLVKLRVGNNQITNLDVSNNTVIEQVLCDNNMITSLNLSNNTLLTSFYGYSNQLTSLNLKNGNNINVLDFRGFDNPDLECIEVDDADYSTANWIQKDIPALFSENCGGDSLSSTYVLIAAEKVELNKNTIVQSGYVGVTDVNGKAKVKNNSQAIETVEASEIDIDNSSSVGTQVLELAEVELPEFIYNNLSNNSSPNVEVGQYETVTLNGSVYEEIEVEKYGTVIFTNQNVYIEDLDLDKNATVQFNQCTNLYVQDKLKFEKYSNFNPSGYSVTVYAEDKVEVKEGSEIKAFIYAKDEKIKAKGKSSSPIYMTGLFIAKEIKGEKYVTWNKNVNFASCGNGSGDVSRNSSEVNTKEKEIKIQNEVIVSKEVITEGFNVKTWPVPSNSNFNVKVSTPNTQDIISINVYDVNGRLVHSNQFNNQNQYTFGNSLQSGIYIVKISQKETVKTIRIVKQ